MPGEISRTNPGPKDGQPPVPRWVQHGCEPDANNPAICNFCWEPMAAEAIYQRRMRYGWKEATELGDALAALETIASMGSFRSDGTCHQLATCIQASSEMRPCEHAIARHGIKTVWKMK